MARYGKNNPKRISDETLAEMRSVWLRWKAAGDRRGYKSLAQIYGLSMWTVRDLVLHRCRPDPQGMKQLAELRKEPEDKPSNDGLYTWRSIA